MEEKKEFEYYTLDKRSYIDRVAFNKCVSTSRKRKGMAELLSRFRVSDKRENGLIKYDESKKFHGYRLGNCATEIGSNNGQCYMVICDDCKLRLVSDKQITWL